MIQEPSASRPPNGKKLATVPEQPLSAEARVLLEICFWLFAGMGVAIIGGLVLIPEYLDYLESHEQMRQVRREVSGLELRNRQYQEALESLSDRNYLERLLRGRAAEATTIPLVGAAEFADAAPQLRLPEPTEQEILVHEVKFPGPRPLRLDLPHHWVVTFTRPDRQPILLAIAVGCLTMAFTFFVHS